MDLKLNKSLSSIWLTADTHLGHTNIIKYCGRYQFMTDEEASEIRRINLEDQNQENLRKYRISNAASQKMDAHIISVINRLVAEDDTLWILGDFCFKSGEVTPAEYRDRILCKNVNLIRGNHDRLNSLDTASFGIVADLVNLTVDDIQITLCHYPMVSWKNSCHGAYHAYGHVHGKYQPPENVRAIDVGVDALGFAPISLLEVKQKMNKIALPWNKVPL